MTTNPLNNNDLNTIINDAIQTAIVNNLLNFRIGTNSETNNTTSRISNRYYNNPPRGGYIVNGSHEYIFPDNDDISSLIFLDVVTRFGSPGFNDVIDPRYKENRRNKIKEIGPYRKIKENDSLITSMYQCPICIEEFCCGQYQRTLECNHTFHKKCIDKWFKKDKNDCPMCRTKIL